MKTIILAAGQGTRLRPLTDNCPKCMVEINGKSIIERQLEAINQCGIKDEDITTIAGYKNDVLQERLKDSILLLMMIMHLQIWSILLCVHGD